MASANDLKFTTDVIVPTLILVGLFTINAFIFAFIIRKRRQAKYENVARAEAEVPCTSTNAALVLQQSHYPPTAPRAMAEQTTDDESCAIEMERL